MTRRLADVVIALAGLVLLAPIGVLAAALVALTSRGPILFRAERVGRTGQRFAMLKLRTMRPAAEGTAAEGTTAEGTTAAGPGVTGAAAEGPAVAGPAVTGAGDPRVTPVGRLLRRTHLDEWPQLWNVLRGEMSVVGPRPEDPRFVDPEDPRWRRVLSVRPGLTGPTQLVWARREPALLRTPDPETTYRRDVLPQKLASDVRYVDRRSLLGDLGCLLRTLVELLRTLVELLRTLVPPLRGADA